MAVCTKTFARFPVTKNILKTYFLARLCPSGAAPATKHTHAYTFSARFYPSGSAPAANFEIRFYI